MSTYVATPKTIVSKWHVIDAEGQVLGRIATIAAKLLQGKHKPTYTPFLDTGDHVVIVNAEKVKLTGRKKNKRFTAGIAATREGCARSAPKSCVRLGPCGSWKKPCTACFPKRRWARRCTEN